MGTQKQTSNLLQIFSRVLIDKGALNIHLPRWVIFIVDLSLVFYAYLMMMILSRNVFHLVVDEGLEYRIFFTLFVYGFSAFLFKIYRGTVRYSGMNEIVRLFNYTLCSSFIIWAAYEFIPKLSNFKPLPLFWIICHGAIAFFFVFGFRIIVKYTYYFVSHYNGTKREQIIVYGSDAKMLAQTNALLLDETSKYKPIAIIDPVNILVGKSIYGVSVVKGGLTKSELQELKKRTGAYYILFLADDLNKLKPLDIDNLLDSGFKLLSVEGDMEYNQKNKQKSAQVHDIRIEDLLNREVIKTNNMIVAEKHKDRTVLITGAAGSIGSEIAWQVANCNPTQLIVLDQAESPLHDLELRLRKAFPNLNLIVFIGDVRNKIRMEELFSQFNPEVLYHAAAYKHVPMMERYPAESVRVNVMGTKILADLAVKYNTRKFVMVSTDKAVNPTNVMGTTKRIAEIYVQSLYLSLAYLKEERKKRTRFITTRFGNVLGSNGSVVPLFKDQISKGGPVTITHKDIIRYFMTIPEACRLVLEAGCMGKGGEIFVFDMGEPVRIYDLAKRMIRLAGLVPGENIEIIETGLRPGEKLYEELLNNEELTMPTHHEKIMVAKVREYDYSLVRDSVNEMIEEAITGNNYEVVRKMKALVPEFKSKNSIYEELDKEPELVEELV